MLTPSYLTTNQSEERPWADHTPHNPLPYAILKNLSATWIPCFMSAINTALSFTTTQMSVDWLYCARVWFSHSMTKAVAKDACICHCRCHQ